MVEYWREKESLSINSLIACPNGEDKWFMRRHPPLFFSTTPTPAQWRYGMGREENGPANRLAAISFFRLSSTTSGCCFAEVRFGAKRCVRGLV